MGEWKRVFCDLRRWTLLLFMAALGLALFFLSLNSLSGQRTFWRTWNTARFYSRTVQDLKAVSPEEMPALLEDKENRIYHFIYWAYDASGFSSPEEAYASVADIPGFAEASKAEDRIVFSMLSNQYRRLIPTLNVQLSYIADYPGYIDRIQTQARQQSQTSIFGAEGSFSRRNLQKTAADFEGMRGVEVTFGNSLGVETWLDFELGDYFHLIGMILFVMALLEERKKGLWSVVRACPNGRLRLGLHRVGILAAASTLCALLFSLLPLLLSLSVFGGWEDLGRTLQSLESFRTSTLHTTILGWLGQYFILKILTGFVIGLLLWCVLGSVANIQFSMGVLAVLLAVEYGLYSFLPVQSVFNVFKYFNLFSYVHTATIDTQYLNVNLFGYPFGMRAMLLAALPVFGSLFALWALWLQCFRRPDGTRDLLGWVTQYLNRFLDFFRSRFTSGMWETYKALILQLNVILLAVMLIASQNLSYALYFYESDRWYQAYLTDAEGPIDEGMDDYLVLAHANTEHAQDAAALEAALSRFERRIDTLRTRAQEGQYEPWLVDPQLIDGYYGESSLSRQQFNAAVAILFVALCCAGLGAFEANSAMVPQVRSTKRGRGALFVRKALIAAGLAAAVWAMVYLRELQDFLSRYNTAVLDAPVQNLDALAAFPWIISLKNYMALLYAIRLVMLIITALISLCLSHRTTNLQSAYLLCAGALGLPAFLAAFGIDVLKWLSPIVPVSSAELLWGLGGGKLMYLLPWLSYIALGIAIFAVSYRKWTKG